MKWAEAAGSYAQTVKHTKNRREFHPITLILTLTPKQARGPSNNGPMRSVFRGEVVIVVGTQGSDPLMTAACQEVALRIANSHFYSAGTPIRLVNDTMLTQIEASGLNLVLIGGPEQNTWSKKVSRGLDVFGETKETNVFRVGPCVYRERGTGFVTVAPHWDEATAQARRAMVVAGVDPEGLRRTVRSSSFSMSQELTRPMFTNMVPDYLVYGPQLDWKGMGGILAAGMYGNNWAWRPDAGHAVC